MVHLLRRHPTPAEARAMAAWRYPAPFDVHDAPDPAVFLTEGPDGEGYYPAEDGDGLVGFAVLGGEARVPGQEPAEGVVDVGMGIRPDATSRGVGTALVEQVVALVRDRTGATAARVAVAASNERSLALCRSAGFREVRRFPGPGERSFVELLRPLP